MIYTVTLNPSVDYVIGVDNFSLGDLNLTAFETKNAGGKGINVSQVLKELGHESQALGFIGGFTGKYITDTLDAAGVVHQFVSVNGDTRINIKLKTGQETEINGQGPTITDEDIKSLYTALDAVTADDMVVIAGSLPSSVAKDTYRNLLVFLNKKGAKVLLDAKDEALHLALPEKPFLVKPNQHELGDLFQVTIDTVEDAVTYGKKLLERGPENVIVSLGGEGALFINHEQTVFANAPKGELKNSVGAGDSVVAGFTAKYIETQDKVAAFAYGVATGSATAFSLAFATKEQVETLHTQIQLKTL